MKQEVYSRDEVMHNELFVIYKSINGSWLELGGRLPDSCALLGLCVKMVCVDGNSVICRSAAVFL